CQQGLTPESLQVNLIKPISEDKQQAYWKDGTFLFDQSLPLSISFLYFLECFCVHNIERTKYQPDVWQMNTHMFCINVCSGLLRLCEYFTVIPNIDSEDLDEVIEQSKDKKKEEIKEIDKQKKQNVGQITELKSVKDVDEYIGGIRDQQMSDNNKELIQKPMTPSQFGIQVGYMKLKTPMREVVFGRTNQNNYHQQNQGTTDLKKWRGLSGATQAELNKNKLLNRIELHFPYYSETNQIAFMEPRLSLRSGIQTIEPTLRELISARTDQPFPFKFQKATQYMYLTIHALHVGLMTVLRFYKGFIETFVDQIHEINPVLHELVYAPFPSLFTSPYPSIMATTDRFIEFIRSICMKQEIQHNKKLAHQIIIKEGDMQQAIALLTKPLQSTNFNYSPAVAAIHSNAIHNLHPAFRDQPHEIVINTLTAIRSAKLMLEQSVGFNVVIAYGDILERTAKFYDFISWMLLRQMGEVGGYGLAADDQYEDDIGFWDYNQNIQQQKKDEQVKKDNSGSQTSSNRRSASPVSQPRGVSSSSSAIASSFLLKHPLVAIQPLFIIEDMKNLIQMLLFNKTTIGFLIHAKNILHLMAFFVLNFQMISHQQTIIEIGEILSQILAPQIDRIDIQEEEDDEFIDSYSIGDKNIFGMPDNEDEILAIKLSNQDLQPKISDKKGIKQSIKEEDERDQSRIQMCYLLLSHPPLFYLFPRALLTFFPNIEKVPNQSDSSSEGDRMRIRFMFAQSMRMMLNDDQLCPILIKMMWERCSDLEGISDGSSFSGQNKEIQQQQSSITSGSQISDDNQFNGAYNYLQVLSHISNDIRTYFDFVTSQIIEIQDRINKMDLFRRQHSDAELREELQVTKHFEVLAHLPRTCAINSDRLNELFKIFISLIRIGPVAKFDSKSFGPIIMNLNFIAATLTDKNSKKLMIPNPKGYKWNPLQIAGLVFDSIVAIIEAPKTLHEAIQLSKKSISEFRRSESPPPNLSIDENGMNESSFINSTHIDSIQFSVDAFNQIGEIIDFKSYRTQHRISFYKSLMAAIKKAVQTNKQSDFDLFLDSECWNEPDLVDPIMSTLIRNAVLVPTGDTFLSVDRKSITMYILQEGKNPFTREPMTLDAIKPDFGLQKKVDLFIAKKRIKFEQKKNKE
ncbi:MAG: hypothetical protein EZS28_024204, partial [Streblomastix strix]